MRAGEQAPVPQGMTSPRVPGWGAVLRPPGPSSLRWEERGVSQIGCCHGNAMPKGLRQTLGYGLPLLCPVR